MHNTNHWQLKTLEYFRIWSILSILSIPISYSIFPSIGKWTNELMLPINTQISEVFFGVEIEKSYWISDSAGFYAQGILLFVFSAFIVILKPAWNYLWIRITTKFSFLQNKRISSASILNYLVAYFLLRYGFDKIIGEQFYFPAPNTLHTELGNLSKDLLYWSTMGASKSYSYFMASAEILAGVLLLWSRTRFVGTFFAFGILLNVFAVNVGFDISVKYLSGCLLFASIILIANYPNQLRMLFGMRFHRSLKIKNKKTVTNIILKFLVITFLAVDIVLPFILQGAYPFESRTFQINEIAGNAKLLNLKDAKRIHIHREGYLIIEDKNQHFESHSIRPINNGFQLNKTKFSITEEKSFISWNEGDSTIQIKVFEVKLNTLELAKDDQHWFVEDMLK